MRKNYKNGLLLSETALFLAFVMLVFCFTPNDNAIYASSDVIYPSIIILDAGHGGEDAGTVGVSGVYEKDLNLEIAEKLGEYFSNAGFGVVFTRRDDKLLYTEEENIKGYRKIYDLKNRVKISNSYSDAIFISIHMNWFSDSSCRGTEIYYADNSDSSMLATCVRDSIVKSIQPTNDRKIKKGSGIYLLEHSDNPAILIECGFLSNPEECEKLSQKEYQKELSFSIVCGIIEYEKNKMNRS